MQSQIPLPTDNIYKFYALFGLLLFIFSCGAIIYVVHSTNDFAAQVFPEMAQLKNTVNPSALESEKLKFLEKRVGIVDSDRKVFQNFLIGFTAFATLLMCFGFHRWHKIQEREDELAELQLKRLRFEVEQLTAATPAPAKEITQAGS